MMLNLIRYYFFIKNNTKMGKGDKKSTKGKIWRGSYGNTRPKGKSQSKTASNSN
jgi:ribosomal small subunit protein bTHX